MKSFQLFKGQPNISSWSTFLKSKHAEFLPSFFLKCNFQFIHQSHCVLEFLSISLNIPENMVIKWTLFRTESDQTKLKQNYNSHGFPKLHFSKTAVSFHSTLQCLYELKFTTKSWIQVLFLILFPSQLFLFYHRVGDMAVQPATPTG